jgi:hypothetical protein
MRDSRELMLHSFDPDCGHRSPRKGAQQDAAKGIAQGDAKARLQRLNDEASIAIRSSLTFYCRTYRLDHGLASYLE